MMLKPIEINRHIESWHGLAQALLQADHRWTPWEKKFLCEMAMESNKYPSERQIEKLLELDSRLLV
jgi:hypothetical protein